MNPELKKLMQTLSANMISMQQSLQLLSKTQAEAEVDTSTDAPLDNGASIPFVGISWYSPRQHWKVTVCMGDNRRKFIGSYKVKLEAIEASLEAHKVVLSIEPQNTFVKKKVAIIEKNLAIYKGCQENADFLADISDILHTGTPPIAPSYSNTLKRKRASSDEQPNKCKNKA